MKEGGKGGKTHSIKHLSIVIFANLIALQGVLVSLTLCTVIERDVNTNFRIYN